MSSSAMPKRNNEKGFTLVELSIVIVIIGLIIAGVTAGQALVKQAQLMALITQANQIRGSVNAFKLQYGGLPGDITNASGTSAGYWPNGNTNGCSAGGLSTANVTADCNGNGDKQISVVAKTATGTAEAYIAWQQLNLAKLYSGSFVPGAATGSVVTAIIAPGTNANIPAAKVTGAGVTLGYDSGSGSGTLLSTTALSKNIILIGATRTGNTANTGFLTPAQASAIDAKADDNNAITGSVYGGESLGAALNTGCAGTDGVYILSSTTQSACTIAFGL